MILGCDIGTGYTKVALMDGDQVVLTTKTPTEAYPNRALERALSELRRSLGATVDETAELIITGWGAGKVSRPHRSVPMIKCLGKAAIWDEASSKTLLCLGTQQSYAVNVNKAGTVLQYRTSDKCASGAGSF